MATLAQTKFNEKKSPYFESKKKCVTKKVITFLMSDYQHFELCVYSKTSFTCGYNTKFL